MSEPPGTGVASTRLSTLAVAAGRPARADQAPVNPPIVLSSTFHSTGTPGTEDFVYGRHGNPTWLPLEETLAALEGAQLPALAFSSGMAAITAALDLVPPGGHLLLPQHAYHASVLAARELQQRCGVQVHTVDVADTAAVIEALHRAGAAHPHPVLWLESPTNPMLEIADLPALTAAAGELGARVIVDNTFATPIAQRPLSLGADVVVHSVTKYLAGHSDVLLGAALTNSPELHARLHERRSVGGAVPSPWDAWLALRGVRTLALRVERSQHNAQQVAEHLHRHPGVLQVRYPGLTDHPQHERAAAQMNGFGSILTVRPHGGAAAAEELTRRVRLWTPATSLGGVESLLERRRRLVDEARTVPEDLIRLSVGIEDAEDLIADLDQALGRAAQ
ncbi:trans-sulfuration enzyme family protein [Ruania zhangjianzhongii]|uniref:trans-sulfuration enzyme family protein n=1 Tax=Ruania zhangjianzhongii TaxID=2603206 RepID=UPI0011C77BEA|nr:aminotransferase class I/II-fold pyridoxal phosphate-dependent enzyme [Ruania zhangjianzhongii]